MIMIIVWRMIHLYFLETPKYGLWTSSVLVGFHRSMVLYLYLPEKRRCNVFGYFSVNLFDGIQTMKHLVNIGFILMLEALRWIRSFREMNPKFSGDSSQNIPQTNMISSPRLVGLYRGYLPVQVYRDKDWVPRFRGSTQCKSMVIVSRDFPLKECNVWVGNEMTPVLSKYHVHIYIVSHVWGLVGPKRLKMISFPSQGWCISVR